MILSVILHFLTLFLLHKRRCCLLSHTFISEMIEGEENGRGAAMGLKLFWLFQVLLHLYINFKINLAVARKERKILLEL